MGVVIGGGVESAVAYVMGHGGVLGGGLVALVGSAWTLAFEVVVLAMGGLVLMLMWALDLGGAVVCAAGVGSLLISGVGAVALGVHLTKGALRTVRTFTWLA